MASIAKTPPDAATPRAGEILLSPWRRGVVASWRSLSVVRARGLAVFLASLIALVVALPRVARADQVAVLPFVSQGSATSVQLDDARKTARAAAQTRHTLASDSQMVTAEMAMKHGNGTREEYMAAGRASHSDWTVTGRVEPHGATYRVELEVCQVESGRVETLAREIDPSKEVPQVAEMLALLLRPEGIAGAEIPWERVAITPPPPPPPPRPPPPPPPPPGPPPVRHAYAEGHPIGVGVGVGVLSALSRAPNANGSATSVLIGGSFGYALAAVPGLELRGNVGGSVAGPQSVSADVGARYAFPLVPTARIFAGPEVGVGVFGALGGEKVARFLMRGALVGIVGLGARVQVEASADLDYAAGGSASLLLVGGTLRGLFRF